MIHSTNYSFLFSSQYYGEKEKEKVKKWFERAFGTGKSTELLLSILQKQYDISSKWKDIQTKWNIYLWLDLVELIRILIWHVMKNSQVHNHDHHQINMKKSSFFFFSFWSCLITCIRYRVGFFMDTCLLNGTRFCSYYLKFRHVQGHILASTYLTKC